MMSRRRLAFIGAILLTIALGYAVWAAQQPDGPVYQTAEAVRGDLATRTTASGRIKAVDTVEVGSQVSGLIAELHADFNTPVKKGQVLARIDPSTYEARVNQNEAELATAKARLDQARADLLEAQRDYDAKRKLGASGYFAARGVETAEATLVKARAALALAKASLEQVQANLNQSRIDLSRTFIRAPVDGVVIDRAINIGQTVAASFQAPKLFVIAKDLSEMQVEASVDEADIGSVAPGQRAEFTVDAYPDRIFNGQVKEVRIAGVENQNVITYTVIITAPNRDGKLLPNMTANATIFLGEVRNVLKVPVMALNYQPAEIAAKAAGQAGAAGGNGSNGGPAAGPAKGSDGEKGKPGMVWVLNGKGKPEQRPVRVGSANDEEAGIIGGALKPGEKVIIGETAADMESAA